MIIEGPARDVDEYEQIGLPVFSRSTTPRTARGRIHGVAVGIAATVSDDPKWVLLALMPLFVAGGMLVAVVREERPSSPA